MATIEPRLMHLLNVNDSKDQLPSIHSTLGASGITGDGDVLLLPPLELNASESTSPTPTKQHQQQAALTTAASILTNGDDVIGTGMATGWPARMPRTVSGDISGVDLGTLDDPLLTGTASASVIGKRTRVLPLNDELIQLPQPLKKQKSNQQVGSMNQVFPPIINGLHEPPPNAAVFPPIASEFDAKDTLSRGSLSTDFGNVGAGTGAVGGTFGYDGTLAGVTSVADTDRPGDPLSTTVATSAFLSSTSSLTLTTATESTDTAGEGVSGSSSKSPSTPKPKRRATKPRRRWTEEETNQLLIGVSRHGLGKWTTILEDPEFSFSNRSAGDLKDRFRTCCPDELRGNLSKSDKTASANASATDEPAKGRLKTKTSLTLEDILIEQGDQYDSHDQLYYPDTTTAEPSTGPGPGTGTTEPPKLRKRRVHRRNMEDMVKLGIQGPFKKSHRRERRPFTEQDDREILEGLQIYGPAWTKIHRHPGFNLSSRQPTDLRDRVRNKYPETYANIEKGVFQAHPPEHVEASVVGAAGAASASAAGTVSATTTGSIGAVAAGAADAQHGTNGANTLLEPSVSTTMENPLSSIVLTTGLESSAQHPYGTHHGMLLHASSSREELPSRSSLPSRPRVEFSATHEPSSVFDMGESSTSAFLSNVGEMGISRLLLDDPQIPSSYNL